MLAHIFFVATVTLNSDEQNLPLKVSQETLNDYRNRRQELVIQYDKVATQPQSCRTKIGKKSNLPDKKSYFTPRDPEEDFLVQPIILQKTLDDYCKRRRELAEQYEKETQQSRACRTRIGKKPNLSDINSVFFNTEPEK